MKNLRKKIFKIAAYMILFALAALGVSVVFSAWTIPGNYKIFTVQSGSMEPSIMTGSAIIVIPEEDYGAGDIITFRNYDLADKPVTHRIVGAEISEGRILYATRGDANKSPDYSKVSQDEIIGKVAISIPYIGYVANAVRGLLGVTAIFAIPVLAIIYGEIRKAYRAAGSVRVEKTGRGKTG